MIDTVLALVPDYGLVVVFCVVALACLGMPLPASILTLTAGGFAAVGDLSLVPVLLTAFIAFAVGDQAAFLLGRRAGQWLMDRFSHRPRLAPMLERSENLLHRYGALAVFLSHTIFSPTCAYVTYLSSAGGLAWLSFTAAALIGAFVWTCALVGLGFMFAAQLPEVAGLVSSFSGIVLAAAVALVALLVLIHRWRTHGAHHVK